MTMKFLLSLTLILAGCSGHSGPAVPLDAQPDYSKEMEADTLNWAVVDRMEEHFGDRVGLVDLGEFDDGEHFRVTHDGIAYLVVYDLDMDAIKSVSKAGTIELETQ